MKKACTALLIVIIISMMSAPAYAASGTISVSGTRDISEFGNNSVITINPGLTVELTNTTNTTYHNTAIVCGAGVTLTLNGVKIDDHLNDNVCPLSFTGSGNMLILEGESVLAAGYFQPGVKVESGASLEITGTGMLETTGGDSGAGIGGGWNCSGGVITIHGGEVTAQGGDYASGIGGGRFCDGGTITVINGQVDATGGPSGAGIGGGNGGAGGNINIKDGTVTATGGNGSAGIGGGDYGAGGTTTIEGGMIDSRGGNGGAGIGGGYLCAGGTINIEGGTVTAQGGLYGAGIGGGENSAGGNINIKGGTVTATGGNNSAGIGGSAGLGGSVNSEGGTITVEGGTVTATGGDYSAGIGGGHSGASGIITIKGGAVTAQGGSYGVGIGGGYFGGGGNVILSGGVIYAIKGDNASYDIGAGSGSPYGTLGISGDTIVFLRTDTCIAPATSHTHETITQVTDGKVYGVSANGWEPNFGVYVPLRTLSYDANGGTGAVPDVIQLINTTITVSDAAGISRPPYTFGGWNTAADGSGADYPAGSTFAFTANTKLYAVWIEIHVSGLSLSSHSQTLNVGESVTIIAAVTPGDTTYPTVTWTSTDDTVATVDNNGKVTATGIGSVTIMATADGKTDACTVIVSPSHLTSVSLNRHSQTLNVGENVTLTATVTPSDATFPEVTWTSSDEAVATVDQNGKITATGIGAATIIAKADVEFDVCTVLVKADTPASEPAPESSNLAEMVNAPIMLPEGAAAIQLPNGEIISNKDMDGTVKLQINIGDLNEDGELEFIALDSEGIPIGAFAIRITDETGRVLALDAADGVNNIFNTVLWIVIGIAGAGAVAAVLYILLRKRNQRSGNSF